MSDLGVGTNLKNHSTRSRSETKVLPNDPHSSRIVCYGSRRRLLQSGGKARSGREQISESRRSIIQFRAKSEAYGRWTYPAGTEDPSDTARRAPRLPLRYGFSIKIQDSAARPNDTMMAAANEAHPEGATRRSITSMW
jgi:hypothetical protein